jgi:nitrite reductase (NADH) small subunit
MSAVSTMPAAAHTVYDLGPIDRIPPGEGQSFRVGGREVAVFRTRGDELFATQARCPHKGGLLADGLVGAGKVICPLHAFKFDIAAGHALGHGCDALATYPVEVTADRRVLISITQPVGAARATSR